MSVTQGKEGSISVDIGGTETTIAEVKDYSFDESTEILSRRVLLFNGTKKMPGIKDATGSINFYYDPADAAQNVIKNGATVSLTLYPQGNETGKTKLELNAIISGLTLPVDVEGFVQRSASFEMDGELTESTVS